MLVSLQAPASSRPLVTVAIAFLDERRFLAAAVGTVRNQTGESWELLLIDDGSTDGSSELADDIAMSDPERIFTLRHPGGVNRGLTASRNLAIARARGEFLCFLDADDLWAEHKLATQLEAFFVHPEAVMVCGPSRHQQLDVVEPGPTVPVCAGAPRLLRRGQFARMRMRGTLTTPPPSDVMYRVNTLRLVGGVPAGPSVIEDQRTFIAVSLRGPVFVGDQPLTIYTVRNDSLYGSTRQDDLAQVSTHREFERWVAQLARRSGVHGLAVIIALIDRRLRRGITRRLRAITDGVRRVVESV